MFKKYSKITKINLTNLIGYQFGNKPKPTNLILIRHAQSVFNAKCHKYPEDKIYSKQAEQEFHHDPTIIDCSLTQTGSQIINKKQLIKQFQNKSPKNTIFFVSPMLRTLQTTKLILQTLNKKYEVKVIPHLSQVLSKICDFCSGIKNKKQQFSQFDFKYLDQWMLENNLNQYTQNWQDPFLDQELKNKVDLTTAAGRRYLKVLKQRFPKALESTQNCQVRSIHAFNKIYQISNMLQIKNGVIVSHNRILKNIQGHVTGKDVQDFDNLQVRKLNISNYKKKLLINQ